MSIAGSGPKTTSIELTLFTLGPFPEGPLVIPESRVQKGDSHYVDKKTRTNTTVFLGLYFMSFFYLFALPLVRKCVVNRLSRNYLVL